ncbi:MAG: selenide, water dikinase SelD [Silicimonas sp.]|nr:selenide, water dikinase SelD [Silicimonas sp.]
MQVLPFPMTKEIVLIGGGHAHALLLRRWGMAPLPGARLTLINPAATAPYTGMLPGFVAGHYERAALEIDLVRLARFAGARIIFGRVEAIDRTAKVLTVEGRSPIPYDVASLDIGVTSDMPEIPGFSDHAIAAKPLGPFADRWRAFMAGDRGPVTVIGGGVAGVELALAIRFALGPDPEVHVVEAKQALRGIGERARAELLAEVAEARVTLIEGAGVAEVGATEITLDDGRTLGSALTVGAAGARPFGWLAETGLDLTDGYVTVDAQLQSSDPAIFAVGDCAHLSHDPRPKAGVFAVRAAPTLAHNLAAAVSGQGFKTFQPQQHYLKLVSLGRKVAVADKWNRAAKGRWVWHWKDRIDRAFMDRLNTPPAMARPALPPRAAEGMAEAMGPKPLCGGCGAKIGANVLDQVLADLPKTMRADVKTGTGDDAAVLRFENTQQVISTDHLRAFWADPWLFARIASVHALGDVWAMGARPQSALVQVTLPPLASSMQAAWLAEIMGAAREVFDAEGAAILGGHSTTGAEFTLGFTVTGLTRTPLTLAGAKAGDALLLSRPIGSGTLLAAEMEMKANGDDLTETLAIMATPQGDTAQVLATSAHAMTDVTGFGLAGHLLGMAKASALGAEIDLDRVPFFSGAETLAQAGIRSSIWASNRSTVDIDTPDTPKSDLLFDPQTAGGLLAALPEDAASTCLDQIRAMGHEAAIIGRMGSEGVPTLRVR